MKKSDRPRKKLTRPGGGDHARVMDSYDTAALEIERALESSDRSAAMAHLSRATSALARLAGGPSYDRARDRSLQRLLQRAQAQLPPDDRLVAAIMRRAQRGG
jgi:hypothetical protein